MKTTVSLFLLLSLVFFVAHADEEIDPTSHRPSRPPQTISCNEFNTKAVSCVEFVSGTVPRPSRSCCMGLKQLAQRANTVANRQAICRCLQQAVKNFQGIQDKYLSKVPGSCNVDVGFHVSMNTNCNAIH